MNSAKAIKAGIGRTGRVWRGVLVTWFVSLALSSLLIFPVRGALTSGFGKSLITERLHDSIDIEVLAELGPALGSIGSAFGIGILLVIISGYVVNIFLSAGLFGGVSLFRLDFFTAAGKYFWSFLFITLLVSIIVLFILFVAVAIPFLFSGIENAMSEMVIIKALLIAGAVFLILLPFFILWIDYARAWQVRSDRNKPLSALGFGLRQTFRTFFSSWIMMVVLLLLQTAYWWLMMKILPEIWSGFDGSINLFFFIAQILIIIRIFFRVFRYSCVTAAMEITNTV